jgi:tetratricopeptide (TPR) repeat protein
MRTRRVFFVGTLLMLCFGLSCTREQPPEALTLFHQGNLAYRQGDFAKAIEEYQAILTQGLESGAVYYNLGNSYLKNDQIALAMLYYERAKLFIPRDPDLKANMTFTAFLLERQPFQQTRSFIKQALYWYQEFWTLREVIWLILGAYMVFGLILFYGIVFGRYKVFLSIISCCILVFSALNGWVLNEKIIYRAQAAIMMSEASATFEPLDEATVHFMLAVGDKVLVEEEDRSWSKVRRLDGRLGWVVSESLAMILGDLQK